MLTTFATLLVMSCNPAHQCQTPAFWLLTTEKCQRAANTLRKEFPDQKATVIECYVGMTPEEVVDRHFVEAKETPQPAPTGWGE